MEKGAGRREVFSLYEMVYERFLGSSGVLYSGRCVEVFKSYSQRHRILAHTVSAISIFFCKDGCREVVRVSPYRTYATRF
jgi:hypothetical protein